MEFVGRPGPFGACGFLAVPGFGSLDADEDEGEDVIGIRPKCSPLPRRRSSITDDELEPGPPLSGSRRVSFADTQGLNLVQVKEFDTWDVPMPPFEPPVVEGIDVEEFYLSPLNFSSPLPEEELFVRIQEQKVELETVELLQGTTILKGIVRVQNISFNKAVYIRTSLDSWSSHFDLLTEYLPDSSDAHIERFSFKLTLVPPFGEQGARVDFCLRYETPVGTFWANNNSRNYVLFCHQRAKHQEEKPKKEILTKKSCLKAVSQTFPYVEDMSALETLPQENTSADESKHDGKMDPVKTSQNADGQSGPSEEERKELQAENRRNCSRRNRRKAARLARVKDYFAQRDGAVNDEHHRGASTPETSQAAGQERTEENHSDTFSEGNGDPGASEHVSEALETTSPAVLNDESPAGENASNKNPEKPESFNNSSAGSETATDAPEHTLHSNNETSEGQNINNLSSSEVEERQQSCILNPELNGNTDVHTDPSVSQSGGFTFGTVIAPLYHQVFGRVGSESQSFSDRGHQAQTTSGAEDLTQNRPREEIKEGSHTVSSDAIQDYEQTGESTAEESNHERFDSTLNSEREEESLTVIDGCNDVEDLVDGAKSEQECTDLSADPPSEDAKIHQQVDNGMDSASAHTPGEVLLLLDDTQEDNLTCDLQNHDEAETVQTLQLDDSSAQGDTQEVVDGQISAPSPGQSRSEDSSDKEVQPAVSCGTNSVDDSDATCQTAAESASLEEEKLLEAFNPEHVNRSAAGETNTNSYFEIPEGEDNAKPETLLEEAADPEEGGDEAMSHHEEAAEAEAIQEGAESPVGTPNTQNDLLADLSDEAEMVSEKTEQVDTGLTDSIEDKNWEMMVEEEEQNVLVNEAGGDVVAASITEDVGEVEMGKVELVVGEDTVDEKTEELVEAEEEAPEDTEESAVRTEEESVVETSEQVQTAQSERRDDDGGITENDSDGWSRQQEPGNHFTDTQGVDTKEADVEGGGEMEIDADDEDDTPGAEQMKPEEREASEEAGEAAEAETVESERVGMESQREGEGSGGARDEAGGASAALSDQRVAAAADKEDAGEGQSAKGQPETHLVEEEDFDASFAGVKSALGIPGGDPESDQSSRDGSSGDSDSDDEVELYMHCLRAVHAGEQANKDAGFAVSKRPAASRSKPLAVPMPSISESLDEEQQLAGSQHAETPDIRPAPAAAAAVPPPAPSRQESVSRNVSWWRETVSCSSISKALLSATLLVVFLVVAYHYDFLACLGLYLISVVWLFCHGEKQPVKNNRIG